MFVLVHAALVRSCLPRRQSSQQMTSMRDGQAMDSYVCVKSADEPDGSGYNMRSRPIAPVHMN